MANEELNPTQPPAPAATPAPVPTMGGAAAAPAPEKIGIEDFTKVEMRDLQITDHGMAAIVTCTGTYEGPQWSGTLKFMRVWLKRDGQWRIIAGSVTQ